MSTHQCWQPGRILILFPDLAELDESQSEIKTLKECINFLIEINAAEALGLLTSLLIKDTNVPADLVWRILQISAKTAFAKVMEDERQLEAHKVVQENLYQVSCSTFSNVF